MKKRGNILMLQSRLASVCLVTLIVNLSFAQLSTIKSYGRIVSDPFRINAVNDFEAVVIKNSFNVDSVSLKKHAIEKKGSSGLVSNLVFPLKEIRPTSGFGFRLHPVYKTVKFHYGVDLKAFYEAVYAFSAGEVVKVAYDARYGYFVVIDHGSGIQTVYAHLSYIGVYVHQLVQPGFVIAISGNTGVSTAPHLHFAIIYKELSIDPLSVFRYMQ